MCLSDQIDNDNDFGLGHWSETDTQYSDAHHMMHVPVTTPEPLNIAATAPMDTSGLEYIGATMSAPAPPPVNPPSNGRSRALSGVPPPIFNGDRDKSELFLDKFMSYEIVNSDAKQFTTPFLKVALCLSYMNGPKIDSWACHQRLWLKAQKDAGVSMMDRSLWDDFEADFRRAYADQDAKLTAYQKLNELRMHRSCNAPTGVKGQTLAKRVRLLGKSTRSYGKPERRGVVSPKVDVQAWPLSNTTVQEELL